MRVDQARRRAVGENAAVLVRQLSFGGTDAAPAADDLAFGLHQAGLRGNGPKQRNLELERCLRKALVQHELDSEPHAAIEQRRSKAAVNSPGRVAVPRTGLCGGNDAALGSLDNVIAERFRHRIQRQRAVDEPLNEFDTAYCSLLVVIDDAKTFPERRISS